MANAIDQMVSRAAKVILVTDCKERVLARYRTTDASIAEKVKKQIE